MKNGVGATLIGGLVAGMLDIIYAFVVYGPLSYGFSPEKVLQSVAGGWIGRGAAFAGGWSTALLGLGTHFMIAIVMAAVFVFMASRVGALTKAPILWGFAYGLVLYVAMNYVVAPLSAAGAAGHFPVDANDAFARIQHAFSALRPKDSDHPWMLPATLFTHTVLVGIPIALSAKRFASQQT
jgi:hypothetical protein